MARTEIDRAVLPSLLDRLTDERPTQSADPPVSRDESARRFRESVQRDLDWLLNARRTIRTGPPESAVSRSVHEYGLPDFTSRTRSDAGWQDRLLEDIAETIRRFEPRLTDVRVGLADDGNRQRVRFNIGATLIMDPSPEQVVFDTVLEVASGDISVEDHT
ncbi:MAG: type VI secretion system baseplate subunit TssE [Gemmatimonadaceae bacterium]|nr:type VI secretion system baseplate subunit TssE [Gemmatimonadaceae bacterium]